MYDLDLTGEEPKWEKLDLLEFHKAMDSNAVDNVKEA